MDLRSEIGHCVYMLGSLRVRRGGKPLSNGLCAEWAKKLRQLLNDDSHRVAEALGRNEALQQKKREAESVVEGIKRMFA